MVTLYVTMTLLLTSASHHQLARQRHRLTFFRCITRCSTAIPESRTYAGSTGPPHFLAGALVVGAFAASSIPVTACENPVKAPEEKNTFTDKQDFKPIEDEGSTPPNPLSSSGLSEEDIDDLVDEILKDPSINISTLPDYLERQIYRSTIRLTLASLYDALGCAHGTELFGHEVLLTRERTLTKAAKERSLAMMRGDVDEKILEDVADRLLANKAINQALIPDAIERKLYLNCLKLVFRILDLFAANFRLTICGHVFGFRVEKSRSDSVVGESALKASSSLTEVDLDKLKEYARKVGVEDEFATEMSFFQKIFLKPQKEMVAQMHASLYALCLGIIDDMLANTKMELLADTISFDIAPITRQSQTLSSEVGKRDGKKSTPKPSSSGSTMASLSIFTAGLGVGITVAALLMGSKK